MFGEAARLFEGFCATFEVTVAVKSDCSCSCM